MSLYAPLDVRVVTPRLELHGATDDLLEQLAPLVWAGKATADPPPWDDPHSFNEPDPDRRVQQWLRGVWRGRGTVTPDRWRLQFAVIVDGQPIGMQDVVGMDFDAFGTVETSSWISADLRRRGIGTETRSAILHLAFAGLGAREALSEAAINNPGSNAISQRLGYERNGTMWPRTPGNPSSGNAGGCYAKPGRPVGATTS